ncbi:hypothetical protein ACFQL4_27370 [Halosimplex aquaticum]
MESDYVETYSGEGGDGSVTLVGVVHDHPASVYRVRRIVERETPSVLALELPPLAVPLYEAYASDQETPPPFGGEMSAAVQAAETDHVVGIDGPSAAFCRRLARTLVGERASVETAMRSARGVASVGKTALACRAAAALTRRTGLRIAVGNPTHHEVTRDDPPRQQVEDEGRQIRTATAVLDALESPPASRVRSETRDAHMADRLRDLRTRGDVVAVIGSATSSRSATDWPAARRQRSHPWDPRTDLFLDSAVPVAPVRSPSFGSPSVLDQNEYSRYNTTNFVTMGVSNLVNARSELIRIDRSVSTNRYREYVGD